MPAVVSRGIRQRFPRFSSQRVCNHPSLFFLFYGGRVCENSICGNGEFWGRLYLIAFFFFFVFFGPGAQRPQEDTSAFFRFFGCSHPKKATTHTRRVDRVMNFFWTKKDLSLSLSHSLSSFSVCSELLALSLFSVKSLARVRKKNHHRSSSLSIFFFLLSSTIYSPLFSTFTIFIDRWWWRHRQRRRGR